MDKCHITPHNTAELNAAGAAIRIEDALSAARVQLQRVADEGTPADSDVAEGEPPGRQRPLGRWAITLVDRCLADVAGNLRVL